MSPLETRKQMLIVESELNRFQLAGDVAALRAEVRAFTQRAKAISSIASTVAGLAAVLAALGAWRRRKPAEPGAKRSWLQLVLDGVGLISSIWPALRSQGGDREGS